jgi:hypothetical protein
VFGSLSGRALCGKAIERFNQKVDRTCGVGPGRNRPAEHKRELECAVRDIGDVQKPPLDFRVTWNGLIDGHRYPPFGATSLALFVVSYGRVRLACMP